jgi:RNA polymerase sigma-70 factor (ECF subfamily)
MEIESSELALRAKNGDKDAFCELVRRYQGMIRAYIARFVRDPGVVLDLAQETFLTAYRRFETFNPDLEFYPWARGIARTVSLQYLRKTIRRKRREAVVVEEAIDQWREQRLADEETGTLEYLHELKKCLKKLTMTSAEILDLRYFKQLSIRRIAQDFGRREGTVRMTLLRIRQALRKCIERELKGQGALR